MYTVMKYKTIYCDPPWPCFGGKGKKIFGNRKAPPTWSPARKYKLMTIEELNNMNNFINDITNKNCHLWMWTVNPHIEDALCLIKKWGFKYLNIITWVKTGGSGLGQYIRGYTEHLLFAKKGKLPYKKINGKKPYIKSYISHFRLGHSVKPEIFRSIIEKISYPPYIELFARKKIIHWGAIDYFIEKL